jgi:diguanylate cyclase (GGDEF)-like protein/PAS domain S-box-containing protein
MIGSYVTLRIKTLITICVIFVGLTVALYGALQTIVLGSFAEQELIDTQLDVERVTKAIQDDLITLEGTTRDWGWWDDTLDYVTNRTEAYFRSNLSNDSPLISNRLSFMVFVDKAGDVVFAKGFDINTQQRMPAPASLLQQIRPGSLLLKHSDPADSTKGLLLVPELGPTLIASVPVVNSAGEAPIMGAVIFGRVLDTEEIQRLSKTTLYSLMGYVVGDPQMPADFRDASAALVRGESYVRPLSEYSVAGYALLDDVNDQPALVLRAVKQRGVYARGMLTVQYFMVALVGVGLVFGIAMIVLLERLVLQRLRRISAGVKSIAKTGDTSARLPAAGGDELTGLSTEINAMLEALQRSRRERHESETRFEAVFESALDPMVIVNDEGVIVEANPAARQMLMLTDDSIGKRRATDYALGSDNPQIQAEWRELIAAGDVRSHSRIVLPSGDQCEVEFYSKANVLRGLHLIAIKDITERKRLQSKLEHQAYHDPLTGLPNRAQFMERLSDALNLSSGQGNMLALLFLDLDDFKVINDSLGHRMGDRLLSQVASRLVACLRPGDTVARLGGDEFTLLVEDLEDIEDAKLVAERIISQVKMPFRVGGNEVFVTTSIGIALNTPGSDTPEEIVRNADIAMYEAKKQGKSRYAIFEQAMNTHIWRRLQVEIEMRRALEQGEFEVYYQPVVHLATGKVVEVEALVRWLDPHRGLISPADFIPIAEETGLIVNLGRWVLGQAAHQLKQWQEEYGADAPDMVSVNLSVRQFREANMVEDMREIVGVSGMEPSRIKLEITESVALDGTETTVGTLKALREMGFHLAMDDLERVTRL